MEMCKNVYVSFLLENRKMGKKNHDKKKNESFLCADLKPKLYATCPYKLFVFG
jgi:hypothetical protein